MKKKKAKPVAKAKVKAKGKAKTKAKVKVKAGKKIVPVKTSILKRTSLKTAKAVKGPIFRSTSHSTLAARADKAPAEKPLSASEIQKFRDVLVEKQEELSEIVHRKKEEQEFQQEEPEIGDEADIATRSVEKELLFDITDSEKQALDGIEAAIRKIEKGVFGRCESCQKTIPRMRLEVMPWARYCINCQARNEAPAGAIVE